MFSRLLSYNLAALALVPAPSPPLSAALVLLAFHALGLTLVAQLMRAPLWLVGVVIGMMLVAQLLPRLRDIFSPSLLAPFCFVYLGAVVRFIWLRLLGGEIPGYFEYTLPDPRVLLHFDFFVLAALLYSALILFSILVSRRTYAIRFAAFAAALAIFVWAIAEYFGQRTFGATGSDPFAYVQMGIDLATRGTAAHHFELFARFPTQTISWYPLVSVGYHLPFNLNGDAITVWPIGGSVAYAIAYRLAGESALYFVNPIFSLLSILVSGLLSWELTRADSKTIRVVMASLVAIIIATSNEIVNWAGITMVDTQALVFSTLAFYCALRVYRSGKWGWAIGAGVFWGASYLVRHTQLVILLGLVPLLLLAPFSARTRLKNFLLACGVALLIALPDLWYHQIYLGSWLVPESEELALFSLNAIFPTLGAIEQSALIGAEFGWLLFFVLSGIFFFTKREKIPSIALLLWLGAALAIHLPYAALRLRDLIPEFPILAFYACYGIVASIAALWKRNKKWASAAAACLIFVGLELMLVRVWNTVPRVFQEPRARFGAMTQTQRESFRTIAEFTPPNALIGASLNSGAVELYSQRSAFRPADWSTENLRQFLELARANNYEIYLLQDNASLTNVLNTLRGEYQIERVVTLDVPLFGNARINDAGALWKITR